MVHTEEQVRNRPHKEASERDMAKVAAKLMLKRVNAQHIHPNFLEVSNVVSADVTEISIQPFLNQGTVSLQSTTGRSVFWLNSLWLVNVVKRVLQYRQHCQFSHWFANIATRENKLPLPHKLLFMHWTRELKPQADLLYKVLELLENTH